LNHAALLVGDVERSRRFYGEVLGLDEVPRPATFDFPGAWFRRGETEIHLIAEREPGRAAEMHPGYADDELARGFGTHIAFEVSSLEGAQRRLGELRVPIAGGPRPRGDGVQQIYVRDPDGYIVELYSWEG
jgi:catechol 2,3-dioxygenase-like lactoylglutathione lyase family enzyme